MKFCMNMWVIYTKLATNFQLDLIIVLCLQQNFGLFRVIFIDYIDNHSELKKTYFFGVKFSINVSVICMMLVTDFQLDFIGIIWDDRYKKIVYFTTILRKKIIFMFWAAFCCWLWFCLLVFFNIAGGGSAIEELFTWSFTWYDLHIWNYFIGGNDIPLGRT